MGKTNVAIIFGGRSQEHEVSLQSAASVSSYLDRTQFTVLGIGIDHQGNWHYQPDFKIIEKPGRGKMLKLIKNPHPLSLIPGKGILYQGQPLAIDIVFPVLHGPYGEDGTIQGLLELLGLPYVGSGVLGSALSMDKEKIKRVWRDYGLPIVAFISLTKYEFFNENFEQGQLLHKIEKEFGFPVFVKPSSSGSSVGVSRVTSPALLWQAITLAFRYDYKILIEKAVKAREIECAVIGNESFQAFAPGEVIPNHSFYSYEAKYLDPNGAALRVPADLSPAQCQEACDLAIKAFQAAEAWGLARVDLFLDLETNGFYLNEINTMPGFTNISMFPRMCEAAGLSYPHLLQRLIELGFKQAERRASLETHYARAEKAIT